MDSTDAPALFVPDGNEDSVDIYEGLDFDSGCKNVTPVKSAPSGLKEAMDLFEEIVTEEQQSKDASYSELKSRFQAAQSQITELHRRLEQLELQNTGLSKENYRLKMNISILLQTARQEVIRKDAEIQRLNQESRNGPYLKSRNLRDPGSTENQRLAPHPLVLPTSSTSQPSSRPRLLPSKQTATAPPPPSAPATSEPPHSKDVTSRNRPPPDTAAPIPPPKQTPNLPDMPPLPPAPLSPPPPPPPLPVSPLREDVPFSLRRDREKHMEPELNSEQFFSRKDCRSSERHNNQTDKHKDKKHGHGHDFERKNNTTSNSGIDRHERRYSHKDQTSNSGDSKSGNKKCNVLTSESDRGKGHLSKGGQSREERRDRTRDRQSRCSDSKEHKRHRDYSRTERRPSKDQQSRERRQERRDEDDGRRRRRDSHSKEKHRSKEHSKKQSKPLEMPSKGKTVAEQVVVEENSPHRKLCFMETLNLTLSPVKKPEMDSEGGQKTLVAATKTQVEESLFLPSMEDMCVIDEVDSSETEAASREHVEPIDKDPKTTPEKGENVDSQKETIVNSISTTSENEILEDNSVHSTSTSKGTEIQKDSLPKCVKGPMTEKSQEAVKETITTTENVISLIPTEAAASNNISNTTNSKVMEDVVSKTMEDKCDVQNVSPDLPQNTPLASSPVTQTKEGSGQETTGQETTSKEVELVSSSLSLESLPQEGLSLPEAINLLTENNENSSKTVHPESTTPSCSEVSKVTSTTQDTSALERYTEISQTPKKSFSPAKFFSPAKSVEKCIKPSSSVPLFHDEDSMMRTLSSLKRIPDAISPLRSPIRISKRNHHHLQKPGHVKSLHKEFSSAPPDGISKKVDVNKENKQPGSPAKADPVALAVPSDPELEEGEILSESDEAVSPLPPSKKTKLTRPIRTKASPKCVLKHKMDEKSVSAKEAKESPGSVQSPPNKSRFKTVCPAATKATFSSIDEVMDTFKLVRAEIRKKYMKLHKTFPKKSFYGVMENFQESFIEFVDGADFGQICNLTKELKSKLKNIIVSVFSKVLNNGIVKRIFEQQAVDLKQKLWDFVDVQVDYLFKDVNTALKSMCKPARAPVEHGNSKGSDKRCKESPVKRKEQNSSPGFSKSKQCAIVPFRTGLGSRGKGIRITLDHSDDTDDQSGTEPGAVVSFVPPTPEKGNTSLVVAHNASMLDKTDFELLTEQQATSLTFNLVRDSQMGEIFKCLLQGSDLLDSSAAVADQSTWTLSTPRKDGERIITITTPGKFHSPSKLLSPNKFESPSRLITTWSSISPRKLSSPNSKVLLNPALFDESCLLEVPSENKTIQRPYSILAEDLAVSLTIPSPLKSDSHLSFLQPPPMQVLSTPDSVLSAHISEDALLDEADATEHDIHLTLDTDNSSCGSSASVGSQGAPTQFLFKPELPMQALVMERSNERFILKIRPASSANTTLTANESLSETLTEEMDCEEPESNSVISSQTQNNMVESIHTQIEDNNKLHEEQKQDLAKQDSIKHNLSDIEKKFDISKSEPSPNNIHPTAKSVHKDKTGKDKDCLSEQAQDTSSEVPSRQVSSSEREEVASESERSLTIAEELESTPEKSQVHKCRDRKRKRNQGKSKAKKCRTDEDNTQGVNLEGAGEEALSPNSLSAKNVIRRKGEVVMAWTREEDRTILLELKTKGASRETFAFLSEKLDKPSGQIAQRFHQLMKLFKKQEKLDT
ncbi:CASP8-associated protein 2 [Boleophthalmus pectinirostris]|uniref:CASP8-associated protein 2 n=1 Tax=Boleophthalmus pectinirostris TaxID=150288 RepID=UPI00242B375B|nr:CASP8-associated protein 2 [Boleophthalmus pectinirostris]